jgi:UbiA prenyltransferase family
MFIASVCFGVLVFSARSRHANHPSWPAFFVSFTYTFLLFFQLRVADEFKDFAEDSAARPYRPVPRGLVRLSELRNLALAALLIQCGLVWWLDARLLVPMAVVTLYLGLMTREFFVGRWLRAHATTYLLSHQVILPLIYFFIAACDWLPAGRVPSGIVWILGMGYFSGMVVEIGRKIRAPGDEEKDVETYSALWGPRRAITAWLCVAFLSGACATRAAHEIGATRLVGAVAMAVFWLLLFLANRFLAHMTSGAGKKIDAASGVWTVCVHLALGAALFQ